MVRQLVYRVADRLQVLLKPRNLGGIAWIAKGMNPSPKR